MKDYIDAMNTSMQGDIIYCTEKLWNEICKSQPERLSEKTYYRNEDGTYPHLEPVIGSDSLTS